MEKKRSLPIGREHALPSTPYPGCLLRSDLVIVLASLQQKTVSLEQEPASEYAQTRQLHRISNCARLPSLEIQLPSWPRLFPSWTHPLLSGYTRFLPRHTCFLPRNTRFLSRHTRSRPGHTRFPPGHSRFLPRHTRIIPGHTVLSQTTNQTSGAGGSWSCGGPRPRPLLR